MRTNFLCFWMMSYGRILINLCNQMEPISLSSSHQVKHPLKSQQFSLFFSFFSLSFFLLHCYSFFLFSFFLFFLSIFLHLFTLLLLSFFFKLNTSHIAQVTHSLSVSQPLTWFVATLVALSVSIGLSQLLSLSPSLVWIDWFKICGFFFFWFVCYFLWIYLF